MRQRVMSVLTLTACVLGLIAIALGWGAHDALRFCRTADECPDLRWPTSTVAPAAPATPAAAAP